MQLSVHTSLALIKPVLKRATHQLLVLFKSPLFLSGLLIRILIMPFAMHADLLSMYWRAYVMAGWDIWQAPFNQYLAHLIYASNLRFMQLLGFDLHEIFFVPFGNRVGSFTSSTGDWLRFVEYDHINSVLFFLKLPHLLFDIAIFALLAYWFKRSQFRKHILMWWWLNPVNIFAFYIFSRHDALTLFFMLVTMLAFARRNVGTMLLALFAAIQVRVQPLLFSPLFIVPYFSQLKTIHKHITAIAWAMGLIFVYWFILQFLPTNPELLAQLRGLPVAGDVSAAVVGIPTSIATQTYGMTLVGIPVFYAVYAVICLLLPGINWGKPRQAFILINSFVALTMSVYFAVNPFSPHYFVWLSLAGGIVAGRSRAVTRWYILAIASWAAMGIVGIGKYAIDQNLFLPVSSLLFGTPTVSALLLTKYASITYLPFSFFRILLTASLAGMSWEILKNILTHFSADTFWNTPGLNAVRYVLKKTPLSKLFALVLAAGIFFSATSATQAAKLPIIAVEQTDAQIQLNYNQPLGQVFKAPEEPFGIIEVRFNTARATVPNKIIFRLRKVGEGEWFYTATYDAQDFYNGHFYPFGFPPIYDPGAYYRFEVELLEEPPEGNLPLAVYIADNRYHDGLMTFKGEPFTKHDLNFRVSTETSSTTLLPYIISGLIEKIREQAIFFSVYFIAVVYLTAVLVMQLVRRL